MIFTYIFARSPNYGLTNRAFGGNIYRQSTRLWKTNMGVFPSGQWGQTVNLLAMPSVVRIHLPPPTKTALLPTGESAVFELSVPQAEREVCFASEAHFVREVCLRHDVRNT